jgi:hypothetical protein
MRPTRFRFRLRTLLILVAVVAVVIASGIKPRQVGAVYDATSMPGVPVFELPIYEKGWLVRLVERLLPTSTQDASTVTPTTQKRTKP